MSSGVVLNESVSWITFHSGYDFGYLLKLMTFQPLPTNETDFFNLLNIYFPTIYGHQVPHEVLREPARWLQPPCGKP